VHAEAGRPPTYYAFSTSADESGLEELSVEECAAVFAGVDARVLVGERELRRALEPAGRTPTDLSWVMLLAAAAMLFAETALVRRRARIEGRAGGGTGTRET
jgi:hypothetical protein